jgi:hypothetical protein
MNKVFWQRLINRRRPDLGAVLVITAVFLLFFAPVLFTGKVFVTNDSFIYSYPLRSVAWDQIRHRSLPLWTPALMSGYPLLSMAQLGLGYPLTWGYLFLPGYLAEELYVLAPFLLGPIFMFAWIRELDRSRLAALFAALAFGYGGMMFSPIAHNGMLTNALMWTPLVLLAIERARTRPFSRSLFWTTVAYSMAVLTGIGQGIASLTIVILAYALFIGVAARSLPDSGAGVGEKSWTRWRPLGVALGAVVIGAGIASFQILETMQAQRLSIRSDLPYEIFSQGSFAPQVALKSLLAPLYFQTDVTVYIVPLAVLLAAGALTTLVRGPQRDLKILFWLIIAVWGWLWMLGPSTPFYAYVYLLPVLNKFRVPSRHTFEWTFAVATMSAYGWDALRNRLASKTRNIVARVENLRFLTSLLLLTGAVVVAWLWWQSTLTVTAPVDSDPQILRRFLYWKLLFTVLILVASWQGWRLLSSSRRTVVLVVAIVIACLVEPATAASYWWWPKAKTPDRFNTEAIATRFLKDKNPQGDRVYAHTSIWAEEYLAAPRIDPPNVSALRGLREVGGYEPLLLERYSRALGNITIDGVYPRPGYTFDDKMFASESHVLDLLNTRFSVGYTSLATVPDSLIEKDGVQFFVYENYFVVKPGERKTLSGANTECDTLALVTALGHSAATPQGTTIAMLRFHGADGRIIERPLQAGVDSAEWAIENPDIAGSVQHQKAPVFDSHPSGDGPFQAYRYWSQTRLNERMRLDHVELVNTSDIAELQVWKASLYDSTTRRSYPLPHYDEKKWHTIYDADKVLIIENQRALPRVWLVVEAEAVDAEEALRRIRGEGEKPFDPKRTALLEVLPEQLPSLSGGMIPSSARAQIVGESPGHLSIETTADTQTILVVSQINYPGWKATVDGASVPLYAANFMLPATIVPAGNHKVELRYAAPGARKGALISALSLLVTLGLGIHSRRKPVRSDSISE